MKISSYELGSPVVFEENKINILVIENHVLFRRWIERIIDGINGSDIGLYLTDDFHDEISFSKYVEIVTTPYAIDFSGRKIATKLLEKIVESCSSYEKELSELKIKLNSLAGNLVMENEFSLTYQPVEDIQKIIKLFDFTINTEAMTLPEIILEYMRVCRLYLRKKLFVFVNLKAFFSKEETELIYKSILYEKFDVLLLESNVSDEKIDCEKLTIIDNDLCEIC